jgi:hypothetical protein
MIVFLEAIGIMSSAATGDKTVGENEKLAKWKAARAKIEALKVESGADPASAKLVEKIDAKIALYESEIELLGSTASSVIGALNQQNQTLGRLVKNDGTGKSTLEMAKELEAAEQDIEQKTNTNMGILEQCKELNVEYEARDLDVVALNIINSDEVMKAILPTVIPGSFGTNNNLNATIKKDFAHIAIKLATKYFNYVPYKPSLGQTISDDIQLKSVMNVLKREKDAHHTRQMTIARELIGALIRIHERGNDLNKTKQAFALVDPYIRLLLLVLSHSTYKYQKNELFDFSKIIIDAIEAITDKRSKK